MLGWIESHGFESLVIYFLASCFIGGMPTPSDNASVMYRWVFSSFTLFSAGLARFAATQFPESKIGQAFQNHGPIKPVVVVTPEVVEALKPAVEEKK